MGTKWEADRAIVVSHDGEIIDRNVLERTRPTPLAVGANVVTALGIQDATTASRLRNAVLQAVRERRSSSLRWHVKDGLLGNIVTVQPTREPGLAVVSVSSLDAPLGAITPELLVDIFEITRAEAEIAAALFLGLDLASVATLRSVELATVRGQVKALLHKIGVPSQRHLMLVLSRVAAAAPPAQSVPMDMFSEMRKAS